MHDKTIKIYRTTEPDHPPDTLQEGELAAGIGQDPARLWIGGPNGTSVIAINEPADDAPSDAVYGRTDGNWVRAVAVAGDTMTGPLVVNSTVAVASTLDVTGLVTANSGVNARFVYAYEGATAILAQPAQHNWFFGGAGNSTATGIYNFGNGNGTLSRLTNGNSNTAVGALALNYIEGGSNNVAVGVQAMADTASGESNSAIGVHALWHLTSGTFNVAVGYQSLVSMIVGDFNVAIGSGALSALGVVGSQNATENWTKWFNTSLGHNSGGIKDGSYNLFLGANAGNNIEYGSNNTIIGSGSFSIPYEATVSGILAIGTGTTLRLDYNLTTPNVLTLQGEARVTQDPTAALGIATKQYVDASVTDAVAAVGPEPPANPQNGRFWWRTTTGELFVFYNDGVSKQWVAINISSGRSIKV